MLRQRERQIDQDFLYYMLSSDELFRQFDRLASGSTVRNLNIGLVKRVEVSFPHLSEQKRIVSVLEEALSGLATAQAHAEENIQNLRELFASHLQLVFTQRDKGWKERRLGELCDILDNQRKPITKRDRVAGAVPYYGATGIQDHVKNFIFDEPLILVGEDGAKWASGERTAFSISGKSWVNNHAHVLRPHRRVVHDHWLTSFLTHSDLTPFVSGLTVPKLNQGSLREIPIPLPPLHVQEKLGRDIRALEEEIQRLGSLYRQKVFASKELKKSLLYSAFSGAL